MICKLGHVAITIYILNVAVIGLQMYQNPTNVIFYIYKHFMKNLVEVD